MHLPTAITQCVLTHAYLFPREHPCCCCQQLPELSTLQPRLLPALSSRALPRCASRAQGAQKHSPQLHSCVKQSRSVCLHTFRCGTSSSALHHCPAQLLSCVHAALRASKAGLGVQEVEGIAQSSRPPETRNCWYLCVVGRSNPSGGAVTMLR